jgi:hypothetical protein
VSCSGAAPQCKNDETITGLQFLPQLRVGDSEQQLPPSKEIPNENLIVTENSMTPLRDFYPGFLRQI